jgi:hypothetical protein
MRRERVTSQFHCPNDVVRSFHAVSIWVMVDQRLRSRIVANNRPREWSRFPLRRNAVLSAARTEPLLAKATALRHSCRTGDVAEWLKAAVC